VIGLASVPVPPHVFSLSAQRLDYGRFEWEGRGLQVRELRSLPLAPDVFQQGLLGGPLNNTVTFGELVKNFVAGISVPVKAASLVLPDAWMRVAFTESEELPSNEDAREEVLRWKLKRLVPFRVDELRLAATPVMPLAGRSEPGRVMMAFAIESLLAQIESAFAGAGVTLGNISNASLSFLGSVRTAGTDRGVARGADFNRGLVALALVDEEGYTLVFARDGEPVLHRFKAVSSSLPGEARASMVGRDLRLTRNFIEQQLPGMELGGVLLAAPAAMEATWADWLAEGLGIPVELTQPRHLPLDSQPGGGGEDPLAGGGPFSSWAELAPLVGAASQEVG